MPDLAFLLRANTRDRAFVRMFRSLSYMPYESLAMATMSGASIGLVMHILHIQEEGNFFAQVCDFIIDER